MKIDTWLYLKDTHLLVNTFRGYTEIEKLRRHFENIDVYQDATIIFLCKRIRKDVFKWLDNNPQYNL